MKRRFSLAGAVCLMVGAYVGAVHVGPAASLPAPTCPTEFDIDFSGTEYADCFRDVLRGSEINTGVDQGGTGHSSLNFTGSTGPASTWLTVYEEDEEVPEPEELVAQLIRIREVTVCADVLLERFNNTKGGGVVAAFQEGVGLKGVGLVVYDAGNTDTLALVTIDGDPANKGKLTNLQTVSLKGKIAEKAWYRVVLSIRPTRGPAEELALVETTSLRFDGSVIAHVDPTDPNSALGLLIGSPLRYEPATPPSGVSSLLEGQLGLIGTAVSSAVNASITNFSNDPNICTPK